MVVSHASVWSTSAAPLAQDPPPEGATYDVVVVGAGVVGLTTALALAEAGASVILLEAADAPGLGVTGQSTAKLTFGHALRLTEVRERHGDSAAAEYAAAAHGGFVWAREHAAGLPSSVEEPHDLYAVDEDGAARLAQHREDAAAFGLSTTVPSDAHLPVAAAGVVRYDEQVLIDPVAYAGVLAARALAAGVVVRTGTTVVGVDGHAPQTVRSSTGWTVRGEHVVMASHVPFPLRSLAFGLVQQRRHYAVAGTVPDAVATTYDVGNGWSTRPWSDPGSDGHSAIAVGGGHPTGAGGESADMHDLHAWAQRHLGMRVTHAWSTQDAFTTDLLPLVGNAPGGRGRLWMATGFGAWGLTLGTAAGLDIAARIGGAPPAYASWNPLRSGLLRHAGTSASVAGRTVGNLVGSLLPTGEDADKPLQPGQGRIERSGTTRTAVCRTADGEVHAVSARCTHLGCVVAWNSEAQSWDCPCHGSRFAPDGSVLHGPAVAPLEPVTVDLQDRVRTT